MIGSDGLQTVQYRLANHYLAQLRKANTAFQRGHENQRRWVNHVDLDWAQIKQWQQWAASRRIAGTAYPHLTINFVLDGYDLLEVRLTLHERVNWLKDALKEAQITNDTHAECLVLFRLVRTLVDLNALDDAEQYMLRLSERAPQSSDRLDTGRSLCSRGLVFLQKAKYSEAQECYQKSLIIFEEHRANALAGVALWGLGTIVHRLGQPQEAYHLHKRQLEYAEASNRVADMCSALTSIANSLTGQDKYAEAEVYARRCVTLCRSLGFRQFLMGALFIVGECAMELLRYDEMLAVFEEAYQTALTINHKRGIVHSLYCLSYAHFRLNNYAKAIDHLQRDLLNVQEVNSPFMLETIHETLALVLVCKGDDAAAIPVLREGLRLARELDSEREKVRCLMVAVMLCFLQGKFEKAALWAGLVYDKSIIDTLVFSPVLEKLEHALGSTAFQQLLHDGKQKKLDEVVAEALASLDAKPAY